MRYRKNLLVCIFMMCATVFMPFARAQASLSDSAQSAILIDVNSGRVLYGHNQDEKRLIASTTKIMTAYLAIQSADMRDQVTIKREHTLVEGTRVYFKEDDVLTVRELLIGVVLQSGNDAALALADHCGGSGGIDAFVEQMNDMALQLGMANTRFANPHGLNDEGHYSTAHDMGILAATAIKDPAFAAVSSMKTGQVGQLVVRNHNKMLWNYEGAIGLKTGYTKKAGRCLVSAAERNGQTLVAVTLDDPSDWLDHTNMLDYGFNVYPERRLCTQDSFICELPVISGIGNRVDVRVSDTVVRALRDDETMSVRVDVELPRFVWAPVKQGRVLGQIRFWVGQECVGVSELYADTEIPEQAGKSLWQKLFGVVSVFSNA